MSVLGIMTVPTDRAGNDPNQMPSAENDRAESAIAAANNAGLWIWIWKNASPIINGIIATATANATPTSVLPKSRHDMDSGAVINRSSVRVLRSRISITGPAVDEVKNNVMDRRCMIPISRVRSARRMEKEKNSKTGIISPNISIGGLK